MPLSPTSKNCQADQNTNAISLFLMFMRNQLDQVQRDRVVRAIKGCESCRILYDELLSFYDESSLVEYRATYPATIIRTDRMIDELINLYQPAASQPEAPMSASSQIETELALEDGCIGCGA